MIYVAILGLDDKIQANDWVKDSHPISAFGQSDYSADDSKAIYWGKAKWRMRAWIGKTLRDFHKFANRSTTCETVMIIRLPDNYKDEPYGMITESEPEWSKNL